MKELLNIANTVLKQLGYKKRGTSFWKIDEGFYKLIDFQTGGHGGRYFFVNVCVHPVGLPELLTSQLAIIDQPKEYECILRQRIEQIVENEQIAAFRRGLVSLEDEDTIQAVINSLPNDVDKWLRKWGSFETLAKVSEDEISNMLTVIPKLKRKAYLMLKFYCVLMMVDKKKALDVLDQYMSEDIEGLVFTQVDSYLKKLCER